jgi:hypothetical protein
MNIGHFLETVGPTLGFLAPLAGLAWEIIENWWWLFLFLLLIKPALFYWIWWRQEIWNDQQKNILLEIKIPKEILKPMRAMESVFAGLWQIHTPANWIEKWWDGQELLNYSFEIAAIDGTPHFFVRCPPESRKVMETHINSQFPEAEIFEVEDYTQKVPQSIPDDNWDLWGTDYELKKNNSYPIKTYREFETEREAKEEKRIDPMSALLEGMSRLQKGEQIWVQVRIKAILDSDFPWLKQGKETIDKLVYREKPAKKSLFRELFEILITGEQAKEEKKSEALPPEMKLTSGEKDVVAGIERKMSKLAYETFIRFIYLGEKKVFFKPNLRLPMSYFTNFVTDNLNAPIPCSPTITKVRRKWYDPFWFPQRRLYLKKRRTFRRYVNRLPYYFPQPGGTFVLNVEELASIYHFPSKIQSPASLLPRVEAKKGEAPLDLPVEE